ncbi:MAG: extracellular solute-binding protein [Deltaproteobacteria bacterium]|nr:extracellular solute-binding protein [Deltaproteobacteria bacterium]
MRFTSTASPKESKTLTAAFKERYPFISVRHDTVSRRGKVRILIAYRAGRISTDIIFGVGGTFHQWKAANAVQNLRVIPGVKKLPEQAIDPEGLWTGINTRYWCLSYNTKLVNKKELPKTWDQLINPKWGNGNLGLGNRPNLWALQLWNSEGPEWTKNFLTRIFKELKPQLRKEGMNAIGQLVAAGEMHGAVPAGEARTKQIALRGAPIAYTCPEPVPVAVEEAVILNKAPNTYAARIFMNWMLSKEGQISNWVAGKIPPVRQDLMLPEFNPWPDQILGKRISYREPGLETTALPKLYKFWNDLWLKGGGTPRR